MRTPELLFLFYPSKVLCNYVLQIKNLWDFVPAVPGDRFLSMLPPWHAYERASEYFIFTYGIQQVYTTVKYLKVTFWYA
jgi:long-chain acyl-CoA synthetase